MREAAFNEGMDNPERPWILTDWDVWMPNPFYQGPPVDHPELQWDDEPQIIPFPVKDDEPQIIPFPVGERVEDDLPF